MLEEDKTSIEDFKVIETLKRNISTMIETLDLDDQFGCIGQSSSTEDSEVEAPAHRHTTLKGSCLTRWNSILLMKESIIDLLQPTQNTLKRIRRTDLFLKAADIGLLKELVTFLKHFERFTELVDTHGATLAILSLFKLQVTKLGKENIRDDDAIKALKVKILEHLDFWLPDSKHCQIHQVLEPGTKCCATKDAVSKLLQEAYDTTKAKGYIRTNSDTGGDSSSEVKTSDQCTTDVDNSEPLAKKRCNRLKQELLQEIRSAAVTASNKSEFTAESLES